jgi:alkyl hydroperoxide reductase subunit F
MSAPEGGTHDIVIVGGGPAGLTAAIYCARQGLRTAVVAGELGGQAMWAHKIENYLGFQLIPGAELAAHFREHVSRFDVDSYEGQYVNAIVPSDGRFAVYSREGTELSGRAVIIASGRAPSRLSVPGEKELVGRGVSYCSTCDGAFFRGKPVVVIGPGESAADAALQMADLQADVTILNDKPLRVPTAVQEKLDKAERVSVRIGDKVLRIDGEERVTGVVVRAAAGEETLPAEGVFVELGSIPAEEFTGGLVEVNDRGEIKVSRDNMTTCPGIFAAGDVTDDFGKQIIIAAGEGARAGMAAGIWLKRQ